MFVPALKTRLIAAVGCVVLASVCTLAFAQQKVV